MSGRTVRRRVRRIQLHDEPGAAQLAERSDLLAAEEPLGIRVAGEALTMTMRTPGDDVDLAAGFLVSEGIVRRPDDIASIRLCDGTTCGHAGHEGIGNIVDVELREGLAVRPSARRNFLTTSACGVCGKASSAELFVQQTWEINEDQASIQAARPIGESAIPYSVCGRSVISLA